MAGSAAGFSLPEAVLVNRKQGLRQAQKRGEILSVVKKMLCTGAQLIKV